MRDRKSFVNVIRFFGQLRNLEKGRPLVFLDETWANAHISKERIWLDDSGKMVGYQERLLFSEEKQW